MKRFFRPLALIAVLLTVACLASCAESSEAFTQKISPVDYSLSDAKFVMCVGKANKDLLDDANDFIGDIKRREDGVKDSILDTVINKYFGDGKPEAVVSEAFTENTDEVLVVATAPDFAPYEYKEGNSYYGIDMELASLLAEKLSMKLVIREAAYDDLFALVESGEADIVISAAIDDPANKKIVNVTDAYYTASQILLVRTGDETFKGCSAPEEVLAVINAAGKDLSVGVQKNTTAESFFNGKGSFTAEDGRGLTNTELACVPFDSAKAAADDLLADGIGVLITDESVADYLVNINTSYPSADTTAEKGE